MAGGHIGHALRRLQGLLGARDAGGPSDGVLLHRYVHARDECAFETLLRRYGPMVLGVCRRLLNSSHDVDDAFQATFLILVRKAPAIGDGERVANWLYGVAYRVAVRARAQAARARARQRTLIDTPCEESPCCALAEELRGLIDQEVNRLPARYREAVVCCYFEGRTQEEAARVLGWPQGTVATRLNRARQLLRNRLVRRGLPVSAGTLLGVLGQGTADASVPPLLIQTALRTGTRSLMGDALPAAVTALADGMARQVALLRMTTLAIGVVSLALATGTVGVGYRCVQRGAEQEAERQLADARVTRGYVSDVPPTVGGRNATLSGTLPQALGVARLPAVEADAPPCDPAHVPQTDVRALALILNQECKLVTWADPDGSVNVWHQGFGRATVAVAGGGSWTAMPPRTREDRRRAQSLGMANAIRIHTRPKCPGGPTSCSCPAVTITLFLPEAPQAEAEPEPSVLREVLRRPGCSMAPSPPRLALDPEGRRPPWPPRPWRAPPFSG
jgi:RNA polymerase sigma factor (sigma-70 family)